MKTFTRAIIIALVLILATSVCYADFTYPAYNGENMSTPKVNERINIVFDNSGNSEPKAMLTDIIKAAAVAENSAIWIYPIAGNNDPIHVKPGKDFAEKYFALYAKSSNEFKSENIMDKAFADLLADTTVSSKRLILYVASETDQLRPEYHLYNAFSPYGANADGVVFSSMYENGRMVENYHVNGVNDANYEYVSTDRGLFNFLLIKNGYSLCDSSYQKENGVVVLSKGKADNNVLVLAENQYVFNFENEIQSELYLGGCMMGSKAYETYKKRNKVSGVALSYNHTVLECNGDEGMMAFAMYTADGTTVSPLNDDIYIPLKNASEVYVYHRSTKGAGVCGEKTTYSTSQDKDIKNIYAPNEEEAEQTETPSGFSLIEKVTSNTNSDSSEEGIASKILSGVLKVITTIIGLLFRIAKILLLAFVVLMIVSRKFRSYIQIKILNTKFGPTYEKAILKVKKIISDIMGAGAKIRGNADLKGDYVFISKASADMGLPNNRISLLVRELESRGISCWLSENGIKAGEDYNVVLPQAIKNCTLFLLFVSPMSVKSSEVVSEIGTAKENKKSIIPVQIEPFDLFKDFPNWAYMLKQYQKTDLFSSKQEEIKALADQVENTYNSLKKTK